MENNKYLVKGTKYLFLYKNIVWPIIFTREHFYNNIVDEEYLERRNDKKWNLKMEL